MSKKIYRDEQEMSEWMGCSIADWDDNPEDALEDEPEDDLYDADDDDYDYDYEDEDEDEADFLAFEADKKARRDFVDDVYAGLLIQCSWKGFTGADLREHKTDFYQAIEIEVA